MSGKYIILRDTREKEGWLFEPNQHCSGMEVGTIKTGDYTIVGLEEYVCIERKGCVSEISANVGKDKDRFKRELERMRPVKHKYIICEFSCSEVLNFPDGAGIPIYKLPLIKMTGKAIMKSLLELQMEYDINILFCDNPIGAFATASSIMKRIYEKYK